VVLRSWEERFGAALVQLEPGRTLLAVERPPRAELEALAAAAEHGAVAPWEDAWRPGALAEYAWTLQSSSVWDLFWPK
jgi:hypothetical protein